MIKQEASATDTPTPRSARPSIFTTESVFSRFDSIRFDSICIIELLLLLFLLLSFCFLLLPMPSKKCKRRRIMISPDPGAEQGKMQTRRPGACRGGGVLAPMVQTNKSGSSPNSRATMRQLMGCDWRGTPFASVPTAMRFFQTSSISSRACRQLPNESASLPTLARRFRQKSTSVCVAARQPVIVMGKTSARSSGEERNACK